GAQVAAERAMDDLARSAENVALVVAVTAVEIIEYPVLVDDAAAADIAVLRLELVVLDRQAPVFVVDEVAGDGVVERLPQHPLPARGRLAAKDDAVVVAKVEDVERAVPVVGEEITGGAVGLPEEDV